MTKTDCLKRIYNALGGTDEVIPHDDTVCDLLHKLGDIIGELPIKEYGIEEVNVTVEDETGEEEIFTLDEDSVVLKAVINKHNKEFHIDYHIEFTTAQNSVQVSDVAAWIEKRIIMSIDNKTILKVYSEKDLLITKPSGGSDAKIKCFLYPTLNNNKMKFAIDDFGATYIYDKMFVASGCIHGIIE
mgnify:CR=1 FL=1